MNYFKWQSEDNLYLVEKFVGQFTADFIELSEEFLLDYNEKAFKLNLISDLSDAEFRLGEDQARLLGNIFLKSKPIGLFIKYAFVIGSWDREEKNLIEIYMESVKQHNEIDFQAFESKDSAYKWLTIDALTSGQIDAEIERWLNNIKKGVDADTV